MPIISYFELHQRLKTPVISYFELHLKLKRKTLLFFFFVINTLNQGQLISIYLS